MNPLEFTFFMFLSPIEGKGGRQGGSTEERGKNRQELPFPASTSLMVHLSFDTVGRRQIHGETLERERWVRSLQVHAATWNQLSLEVAVAEVQT
jgi:hypothetical protein